MQLALNANFSHVHILAMHADSDFLEVTFLITATLALSLFPVFTISYKQIA